MIRVLKLLSAYVANWTMNYSKSDERPCKQDERTALLADGAYWAAFGGACSNCRDRDNLPIRLARDAAMTNRVAMPNR
jgi:hypothetical protein